MTEPPSPDPTTGEPTRPEVASAPLPRNVKVVGAVSLAQDIGSEMLYPLLPTFLIGVLGAPVVALGVAEGLADATAAGMKLVAGRLARAERRRPWMAAGYGLATLGKVILAAAFLWPVAVAGRVIDRIGKGLRGVPRDALIADAVPTGQRGRAFGFHRSMDTVGAVVGPLIALALYAAFDEQIRPVLVLAVIPAVVSTLLVFLVREPPARPSALGRPAAAESARTAEDRSPLPPAFWRALAPLVVFALVNSTDAFLLLRAQELGFGVGEVIVLYVLYNVVYAALGYPAGRLADRSSHRMVMGGGLVAFGLVYLGLGQTTSQALVWVLLPAYGVFAALTEGVSRAWIADLVPAAQRTWALGMHGASTGLGVLIAGLWSGLAWGGTGVLPLTISGVVALGVAAVLLLGGDRVVSPAPVAA